MAPVIVFRNPKAPRRPRLAPSPATAAIARKAALLATAQPDVIDIVERLLDELLDDAGVPRGQR